MTAPDQCCINVKKLLSIRRRPHMTHSGPRRSHFAVTHETAAWINDVISYRLRICRCCSSSKGVLASLYPLVGGGGSNPSPLNTAAASGDSKYLSSSVEGPLSFASLLTPAEKTVVTLISGGSGPRISTPSIDMSSGFC